MSTEFRCPNCGVLFGVLDDSGTVLTIKYRDLFRYVKNGKVSGPCRGCKGNVELSVPIQEPRGDNQAAR